MPSMTSVKIKLVVILLAVSTLWVILANDYSNIVIAVVVDILFAVTGGVTMLTLLKLRKKEWSGKMMLLPAAFAFVSILAQAINMVALGANYNVMELILAFLFIVHIGFMAYCLMGRENFAYDKIKKISVIICIVAVVICFIPLVTSDATLAFSFVKAVRHSLPCALLYIVATIYFCSIEVE